MSQAGTAIFRIPLLAVTLVATAPLLHAEDKTDADGYHVVPVTVGGHTVPIRVKDQPDPFHNVKGSADDGKYNPERIFSHTSTYADKGFAMKADPSAQGNANLKEQDREKFVTKAYGGDGFGSDKTGANKKAEVTEASTFSKGATGFNKNFATSPDSNFSHAATLTKSKTADDQKRTADLGGPEKTQLLADNTNADSNKQYLGPGAQHVPAGVDVKENVVITHFNDISRVNDIPDRPMTIDEVRNLINHQSIPNTHEKPAEASKPLNDPDYKPEPTRIAPDADSKPASNSTSHGNKRPIDDDSGDLVPSPGMMSNPHPTDDSEKLPQR